jgi:hypothetical protein
MQSAIRILLFFGLLAGVGYTIFVNPQIVRSLLSDPKVSQAVNVAEDKVKGATSSLNLDTVPLINSIKERLIEKQIINNPETTSSGTSNNTTENSIQQITNQITEQIKDIPKNQAKAIIQNTCQQIIDNLDKK